MTSLLLLLATQTGIAPKPEPKEVLLKCQLVAFDRVVDWSKLPGKTESFKDAKLGLPFQARLARMNGNAYAGMIYELARETPAFKLLSAPNMKTLLGMPANVSIGDAKTGEGYSLILKPSISSDPNEAGQYLLNVQFANSYRSPEDKTYPFSYTTKIIPGQILALALKPTDQDLTKAVQLITIEWAKNGQASGGR
ncbi:MAG: hypothetical protein ABL949_10865 [Fimbriimonadaceae bacterium]